MKVKEIISISDREQLIEIANPLDYYYGNVSDVPDKLFNLDVEYIAAGKADSSSAKNVLLIDAGFNVDI